MGNASTPVTREKLEEIAKTISSIEELERFIGATAILDAREKYWWSFLKTEVFYRYFGVAAAVFVAAAVLLLTNYANITSKIFEANKIAIDQISGTLATTNTQLKATENSLKGANEQLIRTNLELELAKSDLLNTTNQLDAARRDLNAAQAQLSDANSRRFEAERLAKSAGELAALYGSTLYICEPTLLSGLWSHLSGKHKIPGPPPSTYSEMSMNVNQLRDGELSFVLFARSPGERFATRRADKGTWEQNGNDLVWKVIGPLQMRFSYDEMLSFLSSGRRHICSDKNWCFFKKPSCV